MPRFHLAVQAELNGALEGLGMTDAFGEAADFSRITKSVPLKVGSVRHAADFKVDEHGTVAAAATVVTVESTSARLLPHPVMFDANRPFLFFLREDRTGAVLFSGRLVNPASQPG
jgi:serpin B